MSTETSKRKNINELASDVDTEFREFQDLAAMLDINLGQDFAKGFHAGVKALQIRFLKTKEKEQLAYVFHPDWAKEKGVTP